MRKAKEIYEAVISEPTMEVIVNYELGKHTRLAELYPEGKAVYLKRKMAELRETMTKGKIDVVVKSWINSNFTDRLFGNSILFDHIDKLNEQELLRQGKEFEEISKDKLVKPIEDIWKDVAKGIEEKTERDFRGFLMDYFIYVWMYDELEKIDSETPEDDKPLFTRAGAKAVFDKIRSLDMGWRNERGKPCLGIKEDDPEPFICMLQGKPTAAKMTWIATTPKDKKIPYIKPLYELLRLCGYKHEDIANMVYKYFGKEVDENTMRNWKSDYKRKNDKGKSMKYTSLQKIINAHKSN